MLCTASSRLVPTVAACSCGTPTFDCVKSPGAVARSGMSSRRSATGRETPNATASVRPGSVVVARLDGPADSCDGRSACCAVTTPTPTSAARAAPRIRRLARGPRCSSFKRGFELLHVTIYEPAVKSTGTCMSAARQTSERILTDLSPAYIVRAINRDSPQQRFQLSWSWSW